VLVKLGVVHVRADVPRRHRRLAGGDGLDVLVRKIVVHRHQEPPDLAERRGARRVAGGRNGDLRAAAVDEVERLVQLRRHADERVARGIAQRVGRRQRHFDHFCHRN